MVKAGGPDPEPVFDNFVSKGPKGRLAWPSGVGVRVTARVRKPSGIGGSTRVRYSKMDVQGIWAGPPNGLKNDPSMTQKMKCSVLPHKA